MPLLVQLLLVAGNVMALVGGGYAFVRWLRNWLVQQVAQPIAQLQFAHSQNVEAIQDTRQLAKRAHARIDKLLLREA